MCCPGDVGVVVDGHHVGPQVEAHVVAVVVGAEDAGDDMLSGVLLHMVEAAGPVQGAGDGAAGLHSPVAGVENDAALFVDVGDMGAAQGAVVRRLAADLPLPFRRKTDGWLVDVPLCNRLHAVCVHNKLDLAQECANILIFARRIFLLHGFYD